MTHINNYKIMNTKKDIDKFLSNEIAVIGASRNKKKFGYQVLEELLNKNYKIYPVNPYTDNIMGKKCFKTIASLPPSVRNYLIITPKKQTDKIVNEILNRGADCVWIQQKSDTKEAISLLTDANITTIYGHCIMMFAAPVGSIHKFHRFISKLLGKYPK